jgi:catechol 2,3-dioxygenase-like lactoylglutathione lyase family enzyme
MSAPRASAPTFYHVGIVTADIDDAVEKYSNVFDLAFAPILTSEGVRFTGAYEAEHDIRWAFSVDGPPYIELIQGVGDDLLSAAGGDRIHHIGRWAPHGQVAALKSKMGDYISIDRPGLEGNSVWFADPSHFRGIWVELVDEGTKDEFQTWLASAG